MEGLRRAGKKIVCVVVLLLAAVYLVRGQSPAFRIHFGVKGGPSAVMLAANDVESAGLKPGFHGGLFYEFNLSDQVALRPELLYTVKGGKLVYHEVVDGTVTYSLGYLQAPLLLLFKFTPEVNVHAGVFLSSLITARARNANSSGFDFEGEMTRDDFGKSDKGFILGLEVRRGRSIGGFRYDYGLTNIGKVREISGQPVLFPDARTFSLQAYFGFALM